MGGTGSHCLCNLSVAASKEPLIRTEQNHHDRPGRRGGVARGPFPTRYPMPGTGPRDWAGDGRLNWAPRD